MSQDIFVLKGLQWAHMGTRIQMNRRLLSCLEASVKQKDQQLQQKEAGALLNGWQYLYGRTLDSKATFYCARRRPS